MLALACNTYCTVCVISNEIRILSQSPNFVRNTVSRRQFYEMAAKFALLEMQCATVTLVSHEARSKANLCLTNW